MYEASSERTLLTLGVLPLAAAGVWLTVLREPEPVSARSRQDAPLLVRDEHGAANEARYVGVVVAGQDAELGAELSAEVMRVFVAPGTRVQRGDALLQLAAPALIGAHSLASAQTAEDRSALEAARLMRDNARDKASRMASAPNAFPAREVANVQAEAARAGAEVARLEASADVHRVNLQRELTRADKQLVRAPFDGVLAARFVDAGDFVNAGQRLARVVDDSRFVRFAVPSADQAHLRVGAQLRIEPAAAIAPLTAAVVDIDPELNATAAFGFARAQLQLDAELTQLLPPGTRVAVLPPESRPAAQRPAGSRP